MNDSGGIYSPHSQADPLWRAFSVPGRVPKKAIGRAIEQWDEVAPVFLARLEAYVRDPEGWPEEDTDALLIPLHLFAQMRDTRAYRPLIRLVSLPPELHESVMGDAITETLSKVAASVFDGDPSPMEEAILDPAVDQLVACGLFEALAFLAADGHISRGRIVLLIERCYREMARDEDAKMRWVGWQRVISYLGLTEYVSLVQEAFREEWISPFYTDFQLFAADLQNALEAQERGELPGDPDFGYFTDTIEVFSRWYCISSTFLRDQEKLEREEKTLLERAERQDLPEVWKITGRNDPCPCGSGRKYKKCCLDG